MAWHASRPGYYVYLTQCPSQGVKGLLDSCLCRATSRFFFLFFFLFFSFSFFDDVRTKMEACPGGAPAPLYKRTPNTAKDGPADLVILHACSPKASFWRGCLDSVPRQVSHVLPRQVSGELSGDCIYDTQCASPRVRA